MKKNSDTQKYINEDDPFMFRESLNSSFDIIKTETDADKIKLYYIDVNGKDYRIFIERSKEALHIGFERFYDNIWDVQTVTNDLSAKEVLGIFGTIKQILLRQKFNSVYVHTRNSKKAMLYRRLLYKLGVELNSSSTKDLNFVTDDKFLILSSDISYKPKFKYKIK